MHELPLGTKLKIGEDILLEMTQIREKGIYFLEIDSKAAKYLKTKEGVFACVLEGGKVKEGDEIEVIFE